MARARGEPVRAHRIGARVSAQAARQAPREVMREWLETDGLGGFAMGAADGIRARRYHAVLLAATRPPDARMVLVADLEVYVETAEGRFALSSHRYRGDVVHPDGATRIVSFDHEPWPRWEW